MVDRPHMLDISRNIVVGMGWHVAVFGHVVSTSSKKISFLSVSSCIIRISQSDNMSCKISSEFLGQTTCCAKCCSQWHFVDFDNMSWYSAKINNISLSCLGRFSIYWLTFLSDISVIQNMSLDMMLCCFDIVGNMLSEMLCCIDVVKICCQKCRVVSTLSEICRRKRHFVSMLSSAWQWQQCVVLPQYE